MKAPTYGIKDLPLPIPGRVRVIPVPKRIIDMFQKASGIKEKQKGCD